MKNFLFQSVISLLLYFLFAYCIPAYLLFFYSISITLLDIFVFRRRRVEGLYLILPFLAAFLLFFDSESILRSLQFLIVLPLLYSLRFFVNYRYYKITLVIIIAGLTNFFLNPNWEQYYANKDNIGVGVNNKEPQLLQLKTVTGKDFEFSENKTYVLDFWFSKCGVCFKEMPNLEDWARQNPEYKNNIILVNVVLPQETFKRNQLLVAEYGFQSIYTELSLEKLKEFGVNEFPKQIVIKNKNIEFIGNLTTNKTILIKRIDDYLIPR